MESIEKLTSSYLWDLPQYFQIKENKNYEQKLINVMIKGFTISQNPLYGNIPFTTEEEGLIETYDGMLRYLLKLNSTPNNIKFTYKLIYEFFDFIGKKLEYNQELIDEKEYNSFKNRYSQILDEQGKYFEKNILIEDYEETEHFKGYNEKLTSELLETSDDDYISINLREL